MINLKHVTLRNFLSVGSVTQAVDLDNQELTLILGDNLVMRCMVFHLTTSKQTI